MCFEVYILGLMTDPSSKECPFMSVRVNLIPSSQILSCQRNKTATSSTGRGQMATLYRQTEAVVFLLALSQFPYYPDRNWCVFGWEILVWDTISKEIGTAFASLLSLFWIPFSVSFLLLLLLLLSSLLPLLFLMFACLVLKFASLCPHVNLLFPHLPSCPHVLLIFAFFPRIFLGLSFSSRVLTFASFYRILLSFFFRLSCLQVCPFFESCIF